MRVTQTNIQAGVIDLGVGHPGLSLLPLAELEQAAQHRFAQNHPEFLQYGAEQGDGYFLQQLSGFLSSEYGFTVEPEQLFTTNGISQAIDLVCTVFTQPGDTVFIEEPTYFLVLQIFRDHGLNLVSIPTDAGGMDLDALEAALSNHQPRLIYTIPSFQNPTGATLPLERRERLLELSQRYGFTVVADEVYQMLRYTQTPPPPLAKWAQSHSVISLGSFSKILAPGLRLGWIQAAPKVLQRFAQAGYPASGGGLNPFTSAIVCSALELGLQTQHLAKLRRVYQARLGALQDALAAYLPHINYLAPGGGYFVWLQTPLDTQQLYPQALAAGVRFQPGVKFSSNGGSEQALRLCFAYYDQPELEEAIRRLATVIG